jgi:hypothetical protein
MSSDTFLIFEITNELKYWQNFLTGTVVLKAVFNWQSVADHELLLMVLLRCSVPCVRQFF